jgi:NADH-quinone oxidoreductase subunit M
LNGFVGEFLILLGAFRVESALAAFAATGVILSATYMLWMFQRVNYGEVTNEKNAALPTCSRANGLRSCRSSPSRSSWGCSRNLFLRPIEPAVSRLVNHVQQSTTQRVQARQPSALSPQP